MVQQCLTSHSTHYRSFRRRFYGSHHPTNSVIALKDDGQSTRVSSLKGKEKDVSKKNIINIQHHEDRRNRGALKIRELNQARSKPDTVDRPVRTARIFVHHYNSTQYCKTETVFSIFPFLQINITSQMWPSGGKEAAAGALQYTLLITILATLMSDSAAEAEQASRQASKQLYSPK